MNTAQTMFHTSPESTKPTVCIGGQDNIFDGIFASCTPVPGLSVGKTYVHEYAIECAKICDSQYLVYHADYNIIADVIRRETSANTEEEIGCIADAVTQDDAIHESMHRLLNCRADNDYGAGASWEIQRLRGRVAAALGFDCVEMTDEHGAVYLIVR